MKIDFFIQDFLLKTFAYNGRSSRRSFWLTQLVIFVFLLLMVLVLLMANTPLQQIELFITIANLIIAFPVLSLVARRLHDINRSAWNLLWFITVIGAVYVYYLNTKNGDQAENKYGSPSKIYPNPHLSLTTED